MNKVARSVFITGGGGYLGTAVISRLQREPARYRVTALDVRPVPASRQLPGVEYLVGDVRDPVLAQLLADRSPEVVVHLASIVNPGGPSRREFERSVDVGGTENVLRAAITAGVRQLIVTSSGAAYGYHADNRVPLREDDPLRGNREFAYADHKRQVEELLACFRGAHPELKQLVFRPGTVLGATTDNPITRLFSGRYVLGIRGYDTPFVLIWDQDVADCIARGIEQEAEGIYNLAGDGTLTLREMARMLGKPYVAVPVSLMRASLWLLQRLGRTPHGPEQVLFLQYRPVLANDRLKSEFGFRPTKTSREVFEFFLDQTRGKSGGR